MSDEDPSLYAGSPVLRNKLDIRDAAHLDHREREFVAQRIAEGAPSGKFDLAHLSAIHHHLFHDLYDWAGEIRTVEITKGGHQFQFSRFITNGMSDVHRRIERAGYFHGLSAEEFCMGAGEIIGDVNYMHPFREGNGRTQLLYLQQLADQAGHPLDLSRIDPRRWLDASRSAHDGDHADMGKEIHRVLESRTRELGR